MIVERILQVVDYKGISKTKFYQSVGFSNGFLDKVKDVGSSKLEQILNVYPEINPEWLLLGKGEMIRIASNPAELSENEVVGYLIMNFEKLLGNTNFKIWYDNLYAKAKFEILKESLGMTVIGKSDSPEKKQKDDNN